MSKLREFGQDLGMAAVGSCVTGSLVVYENFGNDLEEYREAIGSRVASTLIFAFILLKVHKKIKKLLPEGTLNKPLSITATSSLVAITTYTVQAVYQDPEVIDATKWSFGLGVAGISYIEYKDSVVSAVKKLIRKEPEEEDL